MEFQTKYHEIHVYVYKEKRHYTWPQLLQCTIVSHTTTKHTWVEEVGACPSRSAVFTVHTTDDKGSRKIQLK